MAIPPDPTGGYGYNYARNLVERNAPGAVRNLQAGTRVAVQTVRSNPRIVQAIVRTSGSVALRAAGASGIEAGISCAAMESFAVTGGAMALSEIIIPVAIGCFAIYTVWSCISYWSSLPPEQRGYHSMNSPEDFSKEYVAACMASEEYGAPAKASARILQFGPTPYWAQGII